MSERSYFLAHRHLCQLSFLVLSLSPTDLAVAVELQALIIQGGALKETGMRHLRAQLFNFAENSLECSGFLSRMDKVTFSSCPHQPRAAWPRLLRR